MRIPRCLLQYALIFQSIVIFSALLTVTACTLVVLEITAYKHLYTHKHEHEVQL